MSNTRFVLALNIPSRQPLAKVGRFLWVHEEKRLVFDRKSYGSIEELAPALNEAFEHLKLIDNPYAPMILVPSLIPPIQEVVETTTEPAGEESKEASYESASAPVSDAAPKLKRRVITPPLQNSTTPTVPAS